MSRSAGILALTCVAAVAAPAAASAATLPGDLDRALRGTTAAVHVADARAGRTAYARRATSRRPLASTTKLLTAAAALQVLGPARQLQTTVLAAGPIEADGTLRGDVVLRGDGDPDFGTTQAGILADAVRAAGVRRVSGAVVADETRFDAVRGGPRTGGAFDDELGAELSALSYDRGVLRPGAGPSANAIAQAAAKFDDLLEARGIALPNFPRVGPAPPGARVLAAAPSAPVRDLVATMLRLSEDFVAEMLTKRIAAERAAPGTTAAGAAILQALAGRSAQLVDGSGLDRRNRASARALTSAVRKLRAAGGAALLARPGQGTLAGRLRGLPCRAKSGTLSGASNLAGFCRTRRGRTLTFAVLADEPAVADQAVRALVRRG